MIVTFPILTQFGGDPGHVVLGGDSAGGQSIYHHLSAFGGKDPETFFHAAIGESAGAPTQFFPNQTQFLYDHFVNATGCANSTDTLACLRSTDVSILQQANINVPFPGRNGAPLFSYTVAIDGTFVPDFIYKLFREG